MKIIFKGNSGLIVLFVLHDPFQINLLTSVLSIDCMRDGRSLHNIANLFLRASFEANGWRSHNENGLGKEYNKRGSLAY